MTLIKGASRGNVNTNVPQRQVTPEIQGTRECGVGRSGQAHDLHSGRPLLLLLRRITEEATPRSPVVALPVGAGLTRISSGSKPVFGPENTLASRPQTREVLGYSPEDDSEVKFAGDVARFITGGGTTGGLGRVGLR